MIPIYNAVVPHKSTHVKRGFYAKRACAPFSGSNRPPFSITFLNVDALRLNEPSPSVFMCAMSDWLLTSRVPVVVVAEAMVRLLAVRGMRNTLGERRAVLVRALSSCGARPRFGLELELIERLVIQRWVVWTRRETESIHSLSGSAMDRVLCVTCYLKRQE